MKRCFMWDAARPFVISHLEYCNSHQARLVKYSVQQLQTLQMLQPALFSTSPSSPLSPPHVCPTPPSPRAAGAWFWHSRFLGEPHAHICRRRSHRTRQPVVCALLQPSTQLSTPCSRYVIVSPGLDSSFYCSPIVKCPSHSRRDSRIMAYPPL